MNKSTIQLTDTPGQAPNHTASAVLTHGDDTLSQSGSARVACAETNNACEASHENRTAAGSGMLPAYVVAQCADRTWGFKTAIGNCTGFLDKESAQRACIEIERLEREEANVGKGVIAVALRKFFYPERCSLSAHSDEMIERKISNLAQKETLNSDEQKALDGLIAERERRHSKRRGKEMQP